MSISTSELGPAVLVLGTPAVTGPNGTARVSGSVEARLLAALAIAALRGTGLTVELLAEQAWGTTGDEGDYGRVHTSVSRLRKKLRDVGVTDPISSIAGAYRLNALSDLGLAAELLARKERTPDLEVGLELLDQAADLWRGEPLAGIDDWRVEDLKQLATDLRVRIVLSRANLRGRLGGASAEVSELRGALMHYGLARQPEIHRQLINILLEVEGPAVAREALESSCDLLGYDSKHIPDSFRDLSARIDRQESQFTRDDELDFSAAERHAYSNVPGPTYTRYVARPQDAEKLRRALEMDKPIVAVSAIGGRGKTALVNHFVRHLPRTGSPRFFAVVWVSDETDPGSTTLATLVNELAKTVNEPRLSQAAPSSKAHRVLSYLQAKDVLFVIDHFQSITDESIGWFLTRLPETSKAIITTTKEHPNISRFATSVEISRPPEGDAVMEFISAMLESAEITDIRSDDAQLRQIWDLADGNLRLVELSIGLLRRRGFADVQALLSDAREAGATSTDVIETVLHTSFANLDPDIATFLRAAACYPAGATWDRIRHISGLPEQRYEAAAEEMLRSSFVHGALVSGKGILRIEPLVARRFTSSQYLPAAEGAGIEDRWMADVLQTVGRVGFCPDDLSRLSVLDDSIEFRNLEYALRWMRKHEAWTELLATTRDLYFYYYVRGLWSPEPNPYVLWTVAASKLGDRLSEFESLVIRANIAAKQQNRTASADLFERLQPLAATLDDTIPAPLLGKYRQALALQALASKDFSSARALWELNLAADSGVTLPDYNASLRWYALCLARQGDPKTREWLERSREHSMEFGFVRALARTNLEIVRHDLIDPSPGVEVDTLLEVLDALEPEIKNLKDPIYLAEYLDTRAEVLRLLGRVDESELLFKDARSVRSRVPSVSISMEAT